MNMKPRTIVINNTNVNEVQSTMPSTSQRQHESDQIGSNCIYRIRRELNEIRQNPPPNCCANIYKDDLSHWTATINGPHGTVYEGGKFKLDIRFPNTYPFRPPKVRFSTRIYHCNVDSRGSICLDILDERWSPVMTIAKVLLSIWILIGECNPNDPLVICIADQYICNRKEHDKIARSWTLRYAKQQSIILSSISKRTITKILPKQASDETLIPPTVN